MNRDFGLIGFPLGHSFSKNYFDKLFRERELPECSFNNFEIEDVSQIEDIIANNPNLEGLTVTIPHKQSVMRYLDSLDSSASEVGAVNCIKIIRESGSIRKIGYNTDVFGFRKSLFGLIGNKRPLALVLGSGGASKAVVGVLKSLSIEYQIVSRSGEMTYESITSEVIGRYKLIINTTPLGMYPNIETKPDLPYDSIDSSYFAFDLVYNPAQTSFMKEFTRRGAAAVCGYDMLLEQANKAWAIYNNEIYE